MSGPVVVLATYRFKPEYPQDAMRDLLKRHRAALLRAGLATAMEPIVLRCKDQRTIIEIFEWIAEDASEKAHMDPGVNAIWGEIHANSEDIGLPPSALPEAGDRWANFTRLAIAYAKPKAAPPKRKAAAKAKPAAKPKPQAARKPAKKKAAAKPPKKKAKARAR